MGDNSHQQDSLLISTLQDLRSNQETMLKIVRSTERSQEHLATMIAPLFDNGQPGEITKIKNDITTLSNARERSKGFLAGIFTLQTIVIAGVTWLLHRVGLLH